jgi:beta-amylase
MASNNWTYPGIGLIMAHDAGMKQMLAQEVEGCGLPSLYNSIPEGEPRDSNCCPDAASLFRTVHVAGHAEEFRSGHGSFFLNWYRKVLLDHGDAVLRSAIAALAPYCLEDQLAFTVKVAGIHWHMMHPSRAAESCAGYTPATFNSEGAYAATARMLAKVAEDTASKISLTITCLEMANSHNDAASAPEDLIAEVRQACLRHRIPLSGENALGFGLPESPQMLSQIVKQARGWSCGRDRMHSVTLLRLDHGFMRHSSLEALRAFVHRI